MGYQRHLLELTAVTAAVTAAVSVLRCAEPSPPPPLHLEGPNVVRLDTQAAARAGMHERRRYLVQGQRWRRGPRSGCGVQLLPRSRQPVPRGGVSVWAVEYDTVTCEFVVAEGAYFLPPTTDALVGRVVVHDTILHAPRRPTPR